MEPNQPDQPPNQKPQDTLYPAPTKGPLSDDHSSYGKPGKWAGEDPDKNIRLYFIVFAIFLGCMFALAVKIWTGRWLFLP